MTEIGTAIKIGQEIAFISHPKVQFIGHLFPLRGINEAIMEIAPEATLFSDEECSTMHRYRNFLKEIKGTPGIQVWLSKKMRKHNFPERIIQLSMAFANYLLDLWASSSNPNAPFAEASEKELEELRVFGAAGEITPSRIQ